MRRELLRSEQQRSPQGHLRAITDGALVVLAFGVAYWLRYELQWLRQVEPAWRVPFSAYLPSVALTTSIIVFVYWLEGAYQRPRGRSYAEELYIAFRGTLIGIAAMIVIVFLTMPNYYSRLIFGYTGITVVLLVGLSRAIERSIVARRRKKGLGVEHVLIVGAGEVARSIMRAVVARPDWGYRIVGFLSAADDAAPAEPAVIGRFPALGGTADVAQVLESHPVDEVIIALPWSARDKIIATMSACEQRDVRVRIVPDLFQMALGRVVVETINGVPLLGAGEPRLHDWQVLAKRAMDVALASVALALGLPLLPIIALSIRLESPGPVIFRQTRVGRGGREFTVLKFRSMRADAEAQTAELRQQNEASGPLFKIRNDPRMTKVGRFLRRTSLDELPQFWNVLRGEMSVIGPRPGLPSEVREYAAWHRRRLEVPPGITGLWQVSGRSDLTFDEMVLLDIYYVENWSAFMDLGILLKTIPTVLFGSGAY